MEPTYRVYVAKNNNTKNNNTFLDILQKSPP
jgi:hypothetical protein